jgi:hypothetical protein
MSVISTIIGGVIGLGLCLGIVGCVVFAACLLWTAITSPPNADRDNPSGGW